MPKPNSDKLSGMPMYLMGDVQKRKKENKSTPDVSIINHLFLAWPCLLLPDATALQFGRLMQVSWDCLHDKLVSRTYHPPANLQHPCILHAGNKECSFIISRMKPFVLLFYNRRRMITGSFSCFHQAICWIIYGSQDVFTSTTWKEADENEVIT